MLTTLPTGRSVGSAAATPVRATTPDAVVLPLQYAVAAKGIWLPGRGELPCAIDCQNALRESNISAWYMNRKPITAITKTPSFRRVEREMTRMFNRQVVRMSLPEVLVSRWQFPLTTIVFDDQFRAFGNDADPGYRQIANVPSYGP